MQSTRGMSRSDINWQLLQSQSDDVHQDIGLAVKHRYPKTGELYKEGHIMKNWKARWFSLDYEKRVLSYYENRDLQEHRGDITLGHHCQISKADDHGGRKFIINVNAMKKNHMQTTYLSCGSSHERDQWYSALEEVAFGPLVSITELFPDSFRNETRLRIVYTMDGQQERNSQSNPNDPNSNRSTPKKRSSTKTTVLVPVYAERREQKPVVKISRP